MQESWVTVYCTDCGEDWEVQVSDLPGDNGAFVCDNCGYEAPVKEFLRSDTDLQVYEGLA